MGQRHPLSSLLPFSLPSENKCSSPCLLFLRHTNPAVMLYYYFCICLCCWSLEVSFVTLYNLEASCVFSISSFSRIQMDRGTTWVSKTKNQSFLLDSWYNSNSFICKCICSLGTFCCFKGVENCHGKECEKKKGSKLKGQVQSLHSLWS